MRRPEAGGSPASARGRPAPTPGRGFLAARVALLAACSALLAACGSLPPPPAPADDARVAPAWLAPLPVPSEAERADARAAAARPEGGGTTADPVAAAGLPHDGTRAGLLGWWRRFDDPLVADLIAAADAASPTVASAASRIATARATETSATAALLPALEADVNASRGRNDLTLPGVFESKSAALQASWELDVFGGRRAARGAATARLEGAQASWHDARVAVAAETADRYLDLRYCEARLEQVRYDAGSRAETARLTELSMRAGFESRANAALALGSAAQGRVLVRQQVEQCEQAVKALTALTALPEPALRERLQARVGHLPQPYAIGVPALPAAALGQRPDVRARGLDVVAASADVREAEAARLPRVVLAGSLGVARYDFAGSRLDGSTWSLGPVSVTLPLFDGGARRANVDAARSRYDEATVAYAQALRTAIREVESALVTLRSTSDRRVDAQVSADAYDASLRGVEARNKSGLASVFELEDARRSALGSQITLIDVQRERVAAWISLYRALGGGWAPAETLAPMR